VCSSDLVKVVTDKNGFALYFSRNAIPFLRNALTSNWQLEHQYLKHLGVYGFRLSTLLQLTQLAQSELEKAESLEQLRWIENGFRIHMAETTYETLSIDSPADLEHVEKYLKSHF
jgi:3-deoxy-manno-octulosonate cytidylyltransferase (CMP-KDO synthetase)